jgi:hypothetical protein
VTASPFPHVFILQHAFVASPKSSARSQVVPAQRPESSLMVPVAQVLLSIPLDFEQDCLAAQHGVVSSPKSSAPHDDSAQRPEPGVTVSTFTKPTAQLPPLVSAKHD